MLQSVPRPAPAPTASQQQAQVQFLPGELNLACNSIESSVVATALASPWRTPAMPLTGSNNSNTNAGSISSCSNSNNKGGLGMMKRTKSHFSMTNSPHSSFSSQATTTSSSSSQTSQQEQEQSSTTASAVPAIVENLQTQSLQGFAADVKAYTKSSDAIPVFNSEMRKVMEPYVRSARLKRAQKWDKIMSTQLHTPTTVHTLAQHHRRIKSSNMVESSVSSSLGVPYTALRSERPFLFDEYSYPLHKILSDALKVDDLSKLHLHQHDVLKPLLDRQQRLTFHKAYDGFVLNFCIPLLHSLAISKKVFHAVANSSNYYRHNNNDDRIVYRYQAFPKICVVKPGETYSSSNNSISEPRCLLGDGHSIGSLTFHIPLTPSFGTNALYTESYPGREDWHPLVVKSFGLGYLFDATRCLHFNLENTTDRTRVSLEFSVIIYRDTGNAFRNMNIINSNNNNNNNDVGLIDSDSAGFCPRSVLEDDLSLQGTGFYDEAIIDTNHHRHGSKGSLGMDIVRKRRSHPLLDPDSRVGSPFDRSDGNDDDENDN